MAHLGQKLTYEQRRKLSDACKGRIPWNKGKTGLPSLSEETKKKLSIALSNRVLSDEHKRKISEAHIGSKKPWSGNKKGYIHSMEARKKLSEAGRKRKMSTEQRIRLAERQKGEKSHFWKGGITNKNKLIRNSTKYQLWREAIFKRDDYTCQICFIRGGRLQADHIKPFAFFPELRFELTNGRALCEPCHKLTPTYLNSKMLV